MLFNALQWAVTVRVDVFRGRGARQSELRCPHGRRGLSWARDGLGLRGSPESIPFSFGPHTGFILLANFPEGRFEGWGPHG